MARYYYVFISDKMAIYVVKFNTVIYIMITAPATFVFNRPKTNMAGAIIILYIAL